MPYVNTYVEIDDVLDEIDTDDLVAELERRGRDYNTYGVDADEMRRVLESIWLKRRMNQDYQSELNQLIYGLLGKVL